MEKEPQDAEHEQSGDPDPSTEGAHADEFAERQQEEEETRGHGPADGSE